MRKPPEVYIDPYRAEDDARTLQRAGEVMGDSKRMAAAHKHLQKAKAAMERVMPVVKPAAKSAGKGKR